MLTQKKRLVGLDNLRGIAVLLMVVDHFLVASGQTNHPLRYTATRICLPIFCILAGALAKDQPNIDRIGKMLGAGIVATWIGTPIGIGQPDILLLLGVGLFVLPIATNLPVLAFAIIQPTTWPIPWTGYQPGTIIALLVVGKLLADRYTLNHWTITVPGMATLGRYPLSIYLVHLGVLNVIY